MLNKNQLPIFLLLISLTLLCLRILFISGTLLVDDEAYYAMYARHMSWGYIDHGPVVAFIIGLFTFVGENDFTVRLGSLFLMTSLSILLYIYGKKFINQHTALILSLSLTANLLFHTNAIIITPDSPLAFFTVLAILFYYIAYFKDDRYIYVGGFMLGMAMLSKISALFPAIGIAIFPILIKEKRYWLKNIHYYGSFILAILVFLPFIVWNIQNDLAFFRYQGAHITRGGSINHFAELWIGLALLIGPLFFYNSVIRPITNLRNWFNITSDMKYFTVVTIIPLGYFLFHSLFTRLELNWVAPVFFGGIFILGLQEYDSVKNKRRLYVQVFYSLFLIILITSQHYFTILPLKGKSDPTNRYFMYQNLLNDTKELIKNNPSLEKYRIVANKFQIPSMINFYLKPKLEAICLSIGYHETLYSFLYDNSELEGKDFIYIHNKEKFPKKLIPYFDSYELLKEIKMYRNESRVSRHSIWLVKNYAGKTSDL